MYRSVFLSIAAVANAQSLVQGPAPSEVLLTTVESGVLPVLPTATPFTGVETIEGAIVYDGPLNPGFTGQLGDAVAQQNTAGLSFEAILPDSNFDPDTGSVITGSITGTVPADGMGVMITVNFQGFPAEAEYGPFVYHIHGMPVPEDGNCTVTMGHLDPTDRGEYYPCDNTAPQTCQAGDLAGKHGNITTTSFTASYLEMYLSTDPTSPYYFGDKSIVVHSSNTTRLTCANFADVANVTSSSTMTAAPAGPTASAGPTAPGASSVMSASTRAVSSATSSTPAVYTGGAEQLAVNGGLFGVLAAFALL